MNSDSTIFENNSSSDEIFTNVSVNIDLLPKSEEVEFIALSKKYKNLLYLYAAIFAAIFLVVGAATSQIDINDFPISPFAIGAGVFILIFGLRATVITLAFPWKGYAIREKDVIYRSGLIWRKVVTIPYSRIQHGELSEGLFERTFKIQKLKLFTAGGSSSDLVIPGIPKERAEKLRAHIMNRVIEESSDESAHGRDSVDINQESKEVE